MCSLPASLKELNGGLHDRGPGGIGVDAELGAGRNGARGENVLPVGASAARGIRTGLVAGSRCVTAAVEGRVGAGVRAVGQSGRAVHVGGASIYATNLCEHVSGANLDRYLWKGLPIRQSSNQRGYRRPSRRLPRSRRGHSSHQTRNQSRLSRWSGWPMMASPIDTRRKER